MHRDVKDPGVGLEQMLGAVAVVHVPVEDGHPFQAVMLQGIYRAQGDIVKKAETHGPVPLGVMPGRAHGAEGVIQLALGGPRPPPA